MKLQSFYLLVLGLLSYVTNVSAQNYWIGSTNESEEIPCYGDSTNLVLQPLNWEVYQTLEDTWDGTRDSSICISVENYNSYFRFPATQIDTSRSVFIRYKFDETNKFLLPSNDLYGSNSSVYTQFINLDHSSNCPNGLCSGTIIGIQVVNEDMTGFNTRYYQGISSQQYGSNYFAACVPTEVMEENWLREYIVKVTPEAFFGELEEALFLIYPSHLNQVYELGRIETLDIPQSAFNGQEYDIYIDNITGGWFNQMTVFGSWPDLYPNPDNMHFIDANPVENPDTITNINLRLNYEENLVYQPFTQIRGGLVEGSDTLRHTVTIENFGGTLCIPGLIEIMVQDGDHYKHSGGQLHLQGERACMQFRNGGVLEVAPHATLQYGHEGLGMMNLRTGGTIRLHEGSFMEIDGTLQLHAYPPDLTDSQEASVHMDLPKGAKLVFGESARVIAPFGGVEFMRLNIHMLGGEIDLSNLDADSRALINLIFPVPEAVPSANMKLYPNPASEVTQVEWISEGEEIVQIHIFDLQGRELQVIEFNIQKGINFIEIPLSDLNPGLYILQLDSPDQGRAVKQLAVF